MHFSLYFSVFSAVVNQRRIPHCQCQIGKIKHCALDRVGEAGLPFLKCTKIHVQAHQVNKLLKSCSKHILKKLFFNWKLNFYHLYYCSSGFFECNASLLWHNKADTIPDFIYVILYQYLCHISKNELKWLLNLIFVFLFGQWIAPIKYA